MRLANFLFQYFQKSSGVRVVYAIKQWKEIPSFTRTDIYSPKMTYSKFLKSLENYIKSKQ